MVRVRARARVGVGVRVRVRVRVRRRCRGRARRSPREPGDAPCRMHPLGRRAPSWSRARLVRDRNRVGARAGVRARVGGWGWGEVRVIARLGARGRVRG